MLKVGELASRSGLTVRTLHHYDSIGLLTPSARSDAGYRLYNRNDIARLHRIQALRRFGMALADIAAFLDSPDASPAAIIGRQIAALDQQIADAAALRAQLAQMQDQLQRGEEPELSAWLTSLEHMTMHDKYFTKAEQQQMPILNGSPEWAALAEELRALIAAGTAPAAPAAQDLARRWMAALARDTGNDPALAARLDAMWVREPAVREHTGITADMRQYIMAAANEPKLALYARHMLPAEVEILRRHFQGRVAEWPGLIAEVQAQMDADPSPRAPKARELAQRWMELFVNMVGPDPATRQRFRAAHEAEPGLQEGRQMTEKLLNFLMQAL
ncbi:MerR family transcriptional regulator [Pseudoduganella sp. UC29_106]|uniref:MerR family transcriptional regulator n=1 Tax=Pseudoduganella sp. UC29_106 TaxID=3374553 RepID=UPI00375848B2